MKTGTAQRVREHISGLSRPFSPVGVARAVGLDPTEVHPALSDMLERGEIQRVGAARYRYVGVALGVRSTQEVRPRIYKAIQFRGAFSAREIAISAESSKSFVFKIIKGLLTDGHLEVVGKQRNPYTDQMEKVYRLRHPDNFHRRYILNLHKD